MKYLKTYEEHEDKSLITSLDLSGQYLTELPDLSKYTNLKYLYCSNNQLTSLPELPDTLEYFDCAYTQLTYLPELPKNLKKLYCEHNQLTSLPELQNTLMFLFCYDNKLTSLPELPESLERLYCRNNQLPFEDLDGYNKWYKENKHIIDKEGLEYTYQLYQNINIYNL